MGQIRLDAKASQVGAELLDACPAVAEDEALLSCVKLRDRSALRCVRLPTKSIVRSGLVAACDRDDTPAPSTSRPASRGARPDCRPSPRGRSAEARDRRSANPLEQSEEVPAAIIPGERVKLIDDHARTSRRSGARPQIERSTSPRATRESSAGCPEARRRSACAGVARHRRARADGAAHKPARCDSLGSRLFRRALSGQR